MSLELIDPTSERQPVMRTRTPRPTSLAGKRVALLDISKSRGHVFLDRVSELFGEHGVAVERFRKPTFTKPAPPELRREIKGRTDLVVEGLAD